jgi:hypothetical protein
MEPNQVQLFKITTYASVASWGLRLALESLIFYTAFSQNRLAARREEISQLHANSLEEPTDKNRLSGNLDSAII